MGVRETRSGSCAKKPAIGETAFVIPDHACVVSNVFDKIVPHQGEADICKVRVDARARCSDRHTGPGVGGHSPALPDDAGLDPLAPEWLAGQIRLAA